MLASNVLTIRPLPHSITASESSDFFESKAHHILADMLAKFTDLQMAGSPVLSG